MTPCTPYCPGVSGFPELECTGCQSLFHTKCVGVPQVALTMLQSTWKCRVSRSKLILSQQRRYYKFTPTVTMCSFSSIFSLQACTQQTQEEINKAIEISNKAMARHLATKRSTPVQVIELD